MRGAEERLRSRWLRNTAPADGRPPRDHLLLLAGIVAGAALLRFAALDARSFWVDEAVVIQLLELRLGEMVGALLRGEEGTPPLYYVLAWFWAKLFGTGEIGLRSLPALLGSAAVPVAYVTGRQLLSSRVGLVAAALFALSPFLVWHAQDARAHSLAVLLAGLSFAFFLRTLRDPRGSTIAWWAAVSVLGVFSHYFVAFVVVAEAAWLLVAFPSRRVLAAAVAVGVSLAAQVPVVLAQKTESIDEGYGLYGPLTKRLVEIPAQVLVGEQPPLQRTVAVLAAVLVAPALWVILRRATAPERRAMAIPALVAGAALALPLAGAAVGSDYLIARNVLPLWLPALLVLAIAFCAARAPRPVVASAIALCVLWVAIDVVTAGVPKFEREDWRGAAATLGPARDARAIVVTPQPGRGPLRIYLSRTGDRVRELGGEPGPVARVDRERRTTADRVRVREIAVVALPFYLRTAGRRPVPPRPDAAPRAPQGFRLVQRVEARYFTLLRFRAPASATLRHTDLVRLRLGAEDAAVLLQEGRPPSAR